MERDYEKKSGHILFLDTDLVITRVWLEHLWNKCPQWINNSIATSQRLIYLICDNDLPWEYDPVRENPDIRDDLLERYKSIIIQNNFPYFVVTGKGKARTANAIKKLNELI
jgi:nicotinamide riboside kinase